MSNTYEGMRWFKCDLQVQTPEDNAHWADDDLRLGEPRRPKVNGSHCENNISEKARKFLERCHDLELDVIGVTDHNFSEKSNSRDWFITHLIEQNNSVAKRVGRQPLVIFPGFEVDVGYHILCLFPRARKVGDLEVCNRNLTKLGLAESERFDGGAPKMLRKDGQAVSLKTVLSLVQGEMGGIVIAAHSDQASGMLKDAKYKDDFKNPELYCVEMTQNPPSQRYKDILEGKNVQWQREGSYPGWIMSSDAKSLKTDLDGNPKENSLGYRYTWIKMSEPSIEALRQAFLDPESRILVPLDFKSDAHPTASNTYPYIKSIRVERAKFLADQEVIFSPNKNCLIGGRGSGKSTLLEYLRLALGKDKTGGNSISDKLARIKNTIKDPLFKATVEYVYQNGVEYTLELTDRGISTSDHEIVDMAAFLDGLPAQFFSQQQLSAITNVGEEAGWRNADMLLELIDGFVSEEIDELQRFEKELQRQILNKLEVKSQKEQITQRVKTLRQEIGDLSRQWQARTDVKPDADRHDALKKEIDYIRTLRTLVVSGIDQLKESVGGFDKDLVLFQQQDTPNRAWFEVLHKNMEILSSNLKEKLLGDLERYKESAVNLVKDDENWPAIKSDLEGADENFRKACEIKGIKPEDIEQLASLAERRAKKESEIVQLEREEVKQASEITELDALQARLMEVWDKQFELRSEAAQQANTLALYEDTGKPFVKVEIKYQGNKGRFYEFWNEFGPKDRRSKLARDWQDSIGDLFDNVILDPSKNFWHALYREIENSPDHGDTKEYIDSNPEAWSELSIARIPDLIDIVLYRSDGSVAGRVSDNTLSDGQRNTAVLALLLAQKGGPLIIDQPEDELDSNFVFNELIPMIRRVKNKRQLIFATHNANLPVNGDADFVYAFEARDGRGVRKAQGGLDRESVTNAVLDIMEGSEKAFMRRRQKYGF